MQGHMVPMDQPDAALFMITQFTRNQSLVVPRPVPIIPAAEPRRIASHGLWNAFVHRILSIQV